MELTEKLHLTRREIIPTNDIMYLQSDNNYTYIYTTNNYKYLSTQTLKILEERIQSDNFLRINRGLLINCNHIKELSFLNRFWHVCLKNGEVLPISRRKYKCIKSFVSE